MSRRLSERVTSRCSEVFERFRNAQTCGLVLLLALVRITASMDVDCSDGTLTESVPDVCTVPLRLNDTERYVIDLLTAEYEYFPHECKLGVIFCNATKTTDFRKGDVDWPETGVGSRSIVRCGYAYDDPAYAYRDCRLSLSLAEHESQWNRENISACPEPPFTRGVDSLARFMFSDDRSNLSTREYCSHILESVSSLLTTRSKYSNDPLFLSDYTQLEDICKRWASECLTDRPGDDVLTTSAVSTHLLRLWNIIDLVFNGSDIFWTENDFHSSLLLMATIFPRTESLAARFEFRGSTVVAESSDENVQRFQMSHSSNASNQYITGSLAASLHSQDAVMDYYNAIILLQTGLRNNVFVLLRRPEPIPIARPPPFRPTPPTSLILTPATPEFPDTATGDGGLTSDDDVTTTTLSVSQSAADYRTAWLPVPPRPPLPRPPDSMTVNEPVFIIGPVMYTYFSIANSSDAATSGSNFTADLVFQHPSYSHIFNSRPNGLMERPICAVRPTKHIPTTDDWTNLGRLEFIWHEDLCAPTELALADNIVKCRCTQPGFYAVLSTSSLRAKDYYPAVVPGTGRDEGGISVFLGFPYSFELHIVGTVLRSVSLACLLTTVLTYVIFSKSRRGAVTRILLNLCVSLITLLVILYVAEQFAGSRLGCRVANIARYYLVLVSLLWNAIEAYNMYRMLVKVFNAGQQSHFVLKAAVVAWGMAKCTLLQTAVLPSLVGLSVYSSVTLMHGDHINWKIPVGLPAVAVAIGLAVKTDLFDGRYDDCVFRCALRQTTLYYGWLLPMSVIILHNLIVFALVVRVLCHQQPGESAGSKRGHWTRLCGACTMLVLLGVPWIFSAFAVIDGTGSQQLEILRGTFNGVFVVSVNLQGLFIFCFHCVRSTAVRSEWKTAWSRVQTIRTTSTTSVERFFTSTQRRPINSETRPTYSAKPQVADTRV